MKIVYLALAIVGLSGCPGLGSETPGGTNGEVPENPEWETHVLPIMDRLCNECHSSPPQQAAPGTFRLDVCEDSNVLGAQVFAARIVARQINTPALPMPPLDYPQQPTPDDNTIVQRWFDNGAPCEGTGANNANNANNVNNVNNANNVNNMTNNGPMFTEVATVLRDNCTGVGCHDGISGGNFTLSAAATDAEVQTAIEGVTTTIDTMPEVPFGTPLVTAGDLTTSAIYLRVNSIDSTVRMPKDLTALQPAEIVLIGEWITAGANYN